MKTKNRIPNTLPLARPTDRPTLGRMVVPVGALAILFSQPMALAGNTWDGGGGNDDWGTGVNWSPDGSPSPGSGNDIFFAGSLRLTPYNNYTAFDDWRNITFNAGAGAFNITGSAIDLFGKIENLSSNTQTFGLASIGLSSATANEFNPVNGNLTITSTNIFTNGNQLKVFGNNGFTLSFAAGTNIQQAGSLAINQNSTVVFNSAHSYTGDTFVNAGKLQFAAGGSANGSIIRIGDTAGTVGAEVNLTVSSGGQSLGNTIVSRPGGAGYGARTIDSQNTSGTNALTGVIALDAAMTLKQAAGGTLNLSGSFMDVKQQVLTVNSAGTINISKPLDSSFAAGGSLIKQGNGTLTLSNASNTYTGTNSGTLNAAGTQIAAGTLAIADDTSLGLAPAGAYNNIQFIGSAALQANATIGLDANRNISIANGATASFNSNGNTLTIKGIVNGSGALTKTGSGALILQGNNTYTGTTTINEGTVELHNSTSSIADTGAVVLGDVAGVVLHLQHDETIGSLAGGGATGGEVQLHGKHLTVGDANNTSYGGVISGNATSNLIKQGAGTLTLSGTNSYGGDTEVNLGTLLMGDAVSDVFATKSVAVASGATLGGSGTITGTLGVSGKLAPGASGVDIQTLTTGTTTWNGGSTWNFDLSSSDTSSDKLNITGNFAKGTVGSYTFDFMGSTPVWNTTYTLVQWSGSLSGFTAGTNFTATGLGSGSYSNSYFTLNSQSLTFTAVPEPTSALAGILLTAGLLRRRRAR